MIKTFVFYFLGFSKGKCWQPPRQTPPPPPNPVPALTIDSSLQHQKILSKLQLHFPQCIFIGEDWHGINNRFQTFRQNFSKCGIYNFESVKSLLQDPDLTNLVSDLADFCQVSGVCVNHDGICVSINHIKAQLEKERKQRTVQDTV